MAKRHSSTRGFARASGLMKDRISRASESRGFAQSRVLTHWPEIVGDQIASIARPVEISYARQGFGATLTVLTTGAQAPMLEMQKEQLRARVNSVYGYNAIARIRITQTAATGFAEGKASFEHRPKPETKPAPHPDVVRQAVQTASPVKDQGLRMALETLATNVLSKSKR